MRSAIRSPPSLILISLLLTGCPAPQDATPAVVGGRRTRESTIADGSTPAVYPITLQAIAHGDDPQALVEVKPSRYALDWVPVVRTLIQKYDALSEIVDCVFVCGRIHIRDEELPSHFDRAGRAIYIAVGIRRGELASSAIEHSFHSEVAGAYLATHESQFPWADWLVATGMEVRPRRASAESHGAAVTWRSAMREDGFVSERATRSSEDDFREVWARLAANPVDTGRRFRGCRSLEEKRELAVRFMVEVNAVRRDRVDSFRPIHIWSVRDETRR